MTNTIVQSMESVEKPAFDGVEKGYCSWVKSSVADTLELVEDATLTNS